MGRAFARRCRHAEVTQQDGGRAAAQAKRGHTVEESFELRSATVKDWTDLIAQRQAKRSLPTKSLGDFTKRNVIRLGLETDCPHCSAKNWSTLTAVDYRLTCERCLKPYDFP